MVFAIWHLPAVTEHKLFRESQICQEVLATIWSILTINNKPFVPRERLKIEIETTDPRH